MTTTQKAALTGGIILLGVLGYALLLDNHEEDRPPIIVGNGSVYLETDNEGSRWNKHWFKKHFAQDHRRGKEVLSFEAVSGECRRSGDTITILYGSGADERQIVLRQHRRLFGKYHTDVEFADDAVVIETPQSGNKRRLTMETDETLTSFRDENGNECEVSDGRIEVRQVHPTQ